MNVEARSTRMLFFLSNRLTSRPLVAPFAYSQQSFKELTASGPVVVDFFATWCGPCKAIAPKIGELSETYSNVRFLQVDVDKQQQIARDLGVTAMPTFILFKNGKELTDRIRGANAMALENAIKRIA